MIPLFAYLHTLAMDFIAQQFQQAPVIKAINKGREG
jgi:hypothetical protein